MFWLVCAAWEEQTRTGHEPRLREPVCVALLAALEQARTVQQAAYWVGMSRRQVQRRLAALPLPPQAARRGATQAWAQRIQDWLAAPCAKGET
jgi:hypothetical protein